MLAKPTVPIVKLPVDIRNRHTDVPNSRIFGGWGVGFDVGSRLPS